MNQGGQIRDPGERVAGIQGRRSELAMIAGRLRIRVPGVWPGIAACRNVHMIVSGTSWQHAALLPTERVSDASTGRMSLNA
jgi:hypothetical protein